MTGSRVLLTTSRVLVLEDAQTSEGERDTHPLLSCTLKWRCGKLWVSQVNSTPSNLPALESQQWLQDCLDNSSIETVCLDPQIGEAGLKLWADTCEQTHRNMFLRLRPQAGKHNRSNQLSEWIQQMINSIAAILLLLLTAPILMALALVLRLDAPGQMFAKRWSIGKRGKLFRRITFWTEAGEKDTALQRSPLRNWIKRSGLSDLPQLINVVQGEMSLFGRHPSDLSQVTSPLSQQQQQQLRMVPGIIHFASR